MRKGISILKIFILKKHAETLRSILNVKEKVSFIIFKGLTLKQIKTTFLEDENPTFESDV